MQRFSTRLLVSTFVATALGGLVLAHDDDPKILDREAPRAGPGMSRTLPPGSPPSLAGTTQPFTSSGVTLLAHRTLGDFAGSHASGNDCWGYTSPGGREYALMGLEDGTGIVEVTGGQATILTTISGPSSLWRDVKTYGNYAYVVSEGGGGVQVLNLTNIDLGSVSLAGTITSGGVSSTHNVAIDETSGFLYRTGGDNNMGLRIYDLNVSPTNPPFVGSWTTKYVHDAQIITYTSGPYSGRQIAFCCSGFNNGSTQTGLTILDVTNKSNIFQVGNEVFWGGAAYSHQCWLSEDASTLFLNDELDEPATTTRTYVINVSNINSASLIGSFTNGNDAVGHNLYVVGNRIFEANYRSGLRIFDFNPLNPTQATEVAWFDTYDANDDASFNGLWSVYPFFESGIVIGSDLESGLFVWWIGAPLLDIVASAATIDPAGDNVPVTISELNSGDYASGTAQLSYSIDGGAYQTVSLTDLGGGSFLAPFPATTCGSSIEWYVSAESTNGLTWTAPTAGAAGPYNSLSAVGLTVAIDDDFETDQGWTATNIGASSGDWQRGIPVDDSGWDYDPLADGDGSGRCYLTQNQTGNTDVDGGSVRLTSPVFDFSGGSGTISYLYYLYLTNDDGDDRLLVEINNNGGTGTWTEVARHDTDGGTSWRPNTITSADVTNAGVTITSSMRMRFTANDSGTQSIVEAGLDAFEVTIADCAGAGNYCTAGTTTNGCTPTMSQSGTPSLTNGSGFFLDASGVEGNKQGLIFYGINGPLAAPWGASTSFRCVKSPVQRTTIQSSGGNAGFCDGMLSIDWLDYVTNVNVGALGGPFSGGEQVWAQAWFRDPPSPETTNLSDGTTFVVEP